MSNKHDLRRLVRSLLEAAVAGNTAASRGLALYRLQRGAGVDYVLYNPENFAKEIENTNGEKNLSLHDIEEFDPSNIIIGCLGVTLHGGKCWDAAEVGMSAAEKGYGPLMYELAMSDYGVMMSDRISTSASARKVWQKYDQRADVKKLPFDDISDPKTPPKEDDCKILPDYEDDEVPYLNQAYAGKGDSSGKEVLMRNHQEFIYQMQKKFYLRSDVEKALLTLGEMYFSIRYE